MLRNAVLVAVVCCVAGGFGYSLGLRHAAAPQPAGDVAKYAPNDRPGQRVESQRETMEALKREVRAFRAENSTLKQTLKQRTETAAAAAPSARAGLSVNSRTNAAGDQVGIGEAVLAAVLKNTAQQVNPQSEEEKRQSAWVASELINGIVASAKNRGDFFASYAAMEMTPEHRANYEKLMALHEKGTQEPVVKQEGGNIGISLNVGGEEVALRTNERKFLLESMARSLGYPEEELGAFCEAVNAIYDNTAPMGGLQDVGRLIEGLVPQLQKQ